MRSLPAVVVAGLLVAACQADQSVSPRSHPTGKPLFVTGCTDTAPTAPGCPVLFSSSELTDNMADEVGMASGTEPLWTGQTDVSSLGPYTCPDQINLARNKVYIPEYSEDATFLVTNLNKVSNDGFSSDGSPLATYAVGTNRTFTSAIPLGKYTMKGGYMKARCKVVTVRSGAGFRVLLGPVTWYDYVQGEVDLADNDASGGSSTRGWADDESGNVTGVGDGGAQQVVDAYFGGLCTVGWEVWVDGVEKCDAVGNRL